MDFDILEKVSSEDKIENGAWIHLEDETTGEKLYRDEEQRQPCRALVRSQRSSAYEKFNTNLRKAVTLKAKGRQARRERVADEETEKSMPHAFAALLVDLENCNSAQPGRHNMTDDEKVRFYKRPNCKSFVEQIFAASADDSNYTDRLVGNDDGEEAPAPKKTKAATS